MYMGDSLADEAIGQACTLLTAALHCRRQSAELKKCLAASGSAGCAHAQQAFATCSHEHASEVISSLVSVASAHCKAEVAAFAACKRGGSRACEEEDLAALRCASLQVLRSATSALRLRALLSQSALESESYPR